MHSTQAARNDRGAQGFTLIEVMITVAIIAILSSVAIPAYTDYLRRGQLPEAFTNLSDYRVKMEQYYQDNRNYGTVNCADIAGGPSWANFIPSGAKYFTYACATTGQAYVIVATGSAGRAVGHDYSVDHNNLQTTTNFKGVAVAKSCWLTRGNEC